MKCTFLAFALLQVLSTAQSWDDWHEVDVTITVTQTNTYYTCPHDSSRSTQCNSWYDQISASGISQSSAYQPVVKPSGSTTIQKGYNNGSSASNTNTFTSAVTKSSTEISYGSTKPPVVTTTTTTAAISFIMSSAPASGFTTPVGASSGVSNGSSSTSSLSLDGTSTTFSSTTVPSTTVIAQPTPTTGTSTTSTILASTTNSATTTIISTTTSSASTTTTTESLTTTSTTSTTAGPGYTSCAQLSANYNPYPVNGKNFLVQCGNKGFDEAFDSTTTDNFVECLQACSQTDGCAATDYDGSICSFYATNDGNFYDGFDAATVQMTSQTPINNIEFNTNTAMFYNYGSVVPLDKTSTTSFNDCLGQCGSNPLCNYVNYYANSPHSCELIGGGPYPLQNSGDYNSGMYVSGRTTG